MARLVLFLRRMRAPGARLLPLTLLLLALPASGAPTAALAAREIAATASSLRGIPLTDGAELPGSVTARLDGLKRSVGELLVLWAIEHRGEHDAAAVQAGVASLLADSGLPDTASDPAELEERPLGGLTLRVSQPTGWPEGELLTAQLSLALPCGSDDALYLLAPGNGSPLVMAHAAQWPAGEAYAAGATPLPGAAPWNGLTFAVSPPSDDGSLFVLAAHVAAPCHSHWQMLTWALLRPGSPPDDPRRLASGSDEVYYHSESGIALSIDGEIASLASEVAQPLDAGLMTRERRLRLRVTGDEVELLAPESTEPRGFLAEWLALPWDAAERLTDPASSGRLASWHSGAQDGAGYTELGRLLLEPARGLFAVELRLWPVEADLESADAGASAWSLWFLMAGAPDALVMHDVLLAPPEGGSWIDAAACDGDLASLTAPSPTVAR